ncbi:MAG: hypothetical protein ABEN55_09780 [Bradymonadaceae bacterium]
MTDDQPGFTDDGIDETLPDVVKKFLQSGADLEEIRLDSRGKWTHEGLDFENPRIIDLFSRSVDRTEGGTWILEVGRFTYPITVEDCGFFVERVDFDRDPPMLKLSDETTEPLDPETLEYGGKGRLYCRVKDGAFRARFKWDAYHALGERFVEEDGEIYLEWDGERVSLGDLADIEAMESAGDDS